VNLDKEMLQNIFFKEPYASMRFFVVEFFLLRKDFFVPRLVAKFRRFGRSPLTVDLLICHKGKHFLCRGLGSLTLSCVPVPTDLFLYVNVAPMAQNKGSVRRVHTAEGELIDSLC
jgi:hypothetical protein